MANEKHKTAAYKIIRRRTDPDTAFSVSFRECLSAPRECTVRKIPKSRFRQLGKRRAEKTLTAVTGAADGLLQSYIIRMC